MHGICIIFKGRIKVIFFFFSYSEEDKANHFSQMNRFLKKQYYFLLFREMKLPMNVLELFATLGGDMGNPQKMKYSKD